MTMTANDNAMTIRECIESLLAREDAEQIRLQIPFFDLDIPSASLQDVLDNLNDQDHMYVGHLFRVAEDGIYDIDTNTRIWIIKAA